MRYVYNIFFRFNGFKEAQSVTEEELKNAYKIWLRKIQSHQSNPAWQVLIGEITNIKDKLLDIKQKPDEEEILQKIESIIYSKNSLKNPFLITKKEKCAAGIFILSVAIAFCLGTAAFIIPLIILLPLLAVGGCPTGGLIMIPIVTLTALAGGIVACLLMPTLCLIHQSLLLTLGFPKRATRDILLIMQAYIHSKNRPTNSELPSPHCVF